MSGLYVLGADPGLKETGLALVRFGHEFEAETSTLKPASPGDMADLIAAVCRDALSPSRAGGAVDAICIEDFVFRAPRATHGLVKHSVAMGRLLGRLDVLTRGMPVHWVNSADSKRDQLEGAAAKRAGIPGRNDHERSAVYAAWWLLGTLRLRRGMGR